MPTESKSKKSVLRLVLLNHRMLSESRWVSVELDGLGGISLISYLRSAGGNQKVYTFLNKVITLIFVFGGLLRCLKVQRSTFRKYWQKLNTKSSLTSTSYKF